MRHTILALAFMAQGALAQCLTYTYTGSPFTSVAVTGTLNNLTVHSPIVARITLAAPLPANAVNVSVLPTIWDYTLVDQNLTSTNGWFAFYENTPESFAFSTDASGNIVGWNVTINWNNG